MIGSGFSYLIDFIILEFTGSPASNGKPSANNVFLINADCVDKISVDDRAPVEHLKPIDFQKVRIILVSWLRCYTENA